MIFFIRRANLHQELQHACPFTDQPFNAEEQYCKSEQIPSIATFVIGAVFNLTCMEAGVCPNVIKDRAGILNRVEFAAGTCCKFAQDVGTHARLCEFSRKLANIEAATIRAE